ncbi:peptidoglycan-binding domain-containing protein [Amycolatopsis taiwanensis]|uniref:Peptidoglycan-binding protein n=1 Tax=Amycolatopsis taiwanensis TaxID=342230 RepID=A0A9W6R999_9PSEU|nr:peptidoglycan-binding domain-containing protein [Amycolatopsis taiwanensis]GLY69902.1 peptidoglycan-binding protein [Amycolatopsis taiwanensis]
MNRRTALVTGTIAVAALVAAAAVVVNGLVGHAPPAPASEAGLPPATATVTRTTLIQTQDVNGTIGYGSQTPVASGGQGTITWLPGPGAVINRGQSVYKRDDLPVPLFIGGLPLYRELRAGLTGADVREVEENLAALGYTGITVDNTYTAATASAVSRWQNDLGLTETGVFDPSSVVIAPGAIRVAAVDAHLGDRAGGGRLLSYTGTTRTVQIALPVAQQTLVRPGIASTITLPDARTVQGTVATVGSVAVPGQQPGDPPTIDVTVTVADQATLGSLDQAPVDVKLVSASVADVFTVPVAALMVLPDGKYGVQVVTGSTSHVVPVDLGMFADGRVQISGAGIAEGTRVGVPS